MAYTADKGEKVLEIQTGLRGGMGPPITYMLDGKQYVALAGGQGGRGAAVVPNREAAAPCTTVPCAGWGGRRSGEPEVIGFRTRWQGAASRRCRAVIAALGFFGTICTLLFHNHKETL